jgi:hypothetical protein
MKIEKSNLNFKTMQQGSCIILISNWKKKKLIKETYWESENGCESEWVNCQSLEEEEDCTDTYQQDSKMVPNRRQRERAGGVTCVLELFTTPFPGLSNTDLFLIQIFFK